MTCFPGWTYEYIDQHMTIPRVLEINKYQATSPPIHILVAGYLGVGSKPSKKSEVAEDGSTLFDMMPRAPT